LVIDIGVSSVAVEFFVSAAAIFNGRANRKNAAAFSPREAKKYRKKKVFFIKEKR
jgi:hypothetical protein